MNERETRERGRTQARALAEVLLRPAWKDLVDECADWLLAGDKRADCHKHGMKLSLTAKMGVNRLPMPMIGKAGGDLVLEPTCFDALKEAVKAPDAVLEVLDGGNDADLEAFESGESADVAADLTNDGQEEPFPVPDSLPEPPITPPKRRKRKPKKPAK